MRKIAQQTSSGTRSVVKGFVYSTAVAALLAAAPAQANDVDEMRAELQNLLDRMERVEQKQTQSANMAALPTYTRAVKKAYVPEIPASQRTSWDIRDRYIMPETARGNGVVGGELPGSFKAPGSDTSVAIHGGANIGAAFNGGQNHVFPINQSATLVPTDAASTEDSTFDMHLYGTSLAVNSMTPTSNGDVGVNLVLTNDAAATAVNQNLYVSVVGMYAAANFTWNGWTFGAQGSSINGVTGGAESVAGLDGLGTFIAPGISYAGGAGGMSYNVAIFAPDSNGFTPLAGVTATQDLPDLHVSLGTSMGGLNVGLGGYAREYGISQTGSCPFTTTTNCGGEETKVGFGINAGVSTALGGNSLNVGIAHGTAPRGMGNYENWSRSEGEQFTVDTTTGSVTGTSHTVITGNITHPWGGTARSTIGATMQSLDVAETSTAATMNRSAQAIANIFWSPVSAINMGVEVNWINVIRKGQLPKESAGVFFKASTSF